ncbi:YeeE/YedE family protein [Candidatus Terasakiella magnetica]|uniref:YeeE/YedE family protein n=1 Tax=Candidatus Terasakiella magnetica TaxID=1867952 RepID=A0A1C3RD86_9PROT|nr:YeeE/YedE thiosulfate transporter family protein [Candidatus Terasakiella magnetica]SCA55247.1 YeeE/YedE family protein [Candidatus Terasakiella magnetica]
MLSWKKGGLLLGFVFLMAVVLVKPIGVSTQFVIFDGILWDAVDSNVVVESTESKSGYASENAYLNKSGGKYAKNVSNPMNYSFVFVIAMIIGAGASALLRGGIKREQKCMPEVWRANFGDSPIKRYVMAFVAGFLVLYGARLAGGCTSGHMMSGMMQTAMSGYIFALGAFVAGIPLAIMMFKKQENA